MATSIGGWASSLHAALIGAATIAARPLLTYRAIDVGAGGVEIGLMATSFALLPAMLAFSIGRRIDRSGPGLYTIGGNVLVLVGLLGAMLGGDLPILYLSSALIGLGLVMAVLAQQAHAALVDASVRDRAFGRMTAAFALGMAAGPILAALGASGLGPYVDWSPTTLALSVCLALGIVALLPASFVPRRSSAPSRSAEEPAAHRVALQILRTNGMWQALLAGAAVLSVLDLLAAFLPLWANDHGVSLEGVNLILGLRGCCTLACRIGYDRVLRVMGRRLLLITSLVAATGGLAALPLVGLAGAIPIMMVLGAGLGIAQPLTMSWISIVVVDGRRAAALGIRQTTNQLAQAALPVLVAAISGPSGATGVFWGSAILLSASALAIHRSPMTG